MEKIYADYIARKLGVALWQVENCDELFAEGCTIPFISRYRKERTGGLDDADVAEIRHWRDVFAEMEKRKATILTTIGEQGKLTDALRAQITACVNAAELEDLYLPYRPKRKTRATVAVARGLEPLADLLWKGKSRNPLDDARRYTGPEVATPEDALAGARDIIAERLAETAVIRENLRAVYRTRRVVSKAARGAADKPEAQKYRSYFQYAQPLSRIPSYNLLAILRGADEGFLTVSVDADPEKCVNKMYYDFCQAQGYPSRESGAEIRKAAEDSYKRLLDASLTGEVLREAKQKADVESVRVFGDNLRQLLLAPPLGHRRVMAIDPGFRTGCKVVCLDAQGNLLHYETIFPHPPVSKKIQAITAVADMVEQYEIEVIAVGSGTAGRETEDFVRKVGLDSGIRIFSVSEDGASVYSASDVGRAEFPDQDVTVRGAVSIGRRLMDPLSELVKIDPKSLGVGQYQHDVDQTLLREKLDNTVEYCVNLVGVDLNTASPWLLRYVSGIGPSLSENIVAYRTQNGRFHSREELRKVPRLGEKAFQQCAGFLRIPGAKNPLDNSAVHPEAYPVVDRIARDLGVKTADLVGNKELLSRVDPTRYVTPEAGLPTLKDILSELAKPGRDPREEVQEFSFADDVRDIADLKPGMELPGLVTNVTAFGAFVDIGLHENGLIHASRLHGNTLKLRQPVKVRVVSVDPERSRIGLEWIG